MIDDARALYQVPPKGFVAARNALATQLKAAGRKDDAAEVSTLRRPRLSEHGLNLVAGADAALVDSFAAAVSAARAAQRRAIEHGEGGALRSATDDLRRASAALAEAAVRALDAEGDKGEAQRMEILEILRGALSTSALEQLRSGLLGSAVVDETGDDAAGEEESAEPTRRARATTSAAKKPEKKKPATKKPETKTETKTSSAKPETTRPSAPARDRGTTAAERRSQAQAAKALATRRRSLERELRTAEDRVEAAARVAARARASLRDAEAAAERAATALAGAERAAEQARTELDSLSRPALQKGHAARN